MRSALGRSEQPCRTRSGVSFGSISRSSSQCLRTAGFIHRSQGRTNRLRGNRLGQQKSAAVSTDICKPHFAQHHLLIHWSGPWSLTKGCSSIEGHALWFWVSVHSFIIGCDTSRVLSDPPCIFIWFDFTQNQKDLPPKFAVLPSGWGLWLFSDP